jgi:hypothetical protein
MQTGNICVLQHAQGGATIHLATGLSPERTIETLARVLDDTRPAWFGEEKITADEQARREGRFTSSVVAQFANEISGGNIRDAEAMGDLQVTGYPQQATQSIIVDPSSQRVWSSPVDAKFGSGQSVPTDKALGFDDFIQSTAKQPEDLVRSLGLKQRGN